MYLDIVPEDQEERDAVPVNPDGTPGEGSPGVGIRAYAEGFVEQAYPENYIEVTMQVGYPLPAGEYVLWRSSDKICVYHGVTRDNVTTVLGFNEGQEAAFDPGGDITTLWVEWMGPATGDAYLELRWRSPGGDDIPGDRLRFYPFKSILIAWSGEVTFGSPRDHGTYDMAVNLYNRGYDVHYYNEDAGWQEPLSQAGTAFNDRDVVGLGIYGFSHGGGNVHDFCYHLENDPFMPTGLDTKFANYIDAVAQPLWREERRRPPGAVYFSNFFEERILWHGWYVDDPQEGDFQLKVDDTSWGAHLTHGNIHHDQNVQNAVLIGRIQGQRQVNLWGILDRVER
jgi:hypothetical protein